MEQDRFGMTATRTSLVDEQDGARLRHPSLRLPIDLTRRRAADRLAAAGHPWPAQAALLIAARVRLGLDRSEFAAAVGVPESIVATLEDGIPAPE